LSDYKTIKFELDKKVARITFNRPEVKNAFNADMISEISSLYEEINKRNDIRVVVMTGSGNAYCAGADLKWMGDVLKYSYEENLEDSNNLARMFYNINNCPFPTIARVNGAAIGGGCGLAAVCDIVIASEKAIFSLSEVKIGLVPACISPYVIRRMGDKYSREYFLTGERLNAEKALAAGLANKVASEAELDTVVDSLVRQLLSSGPKALAWCKQLLQNVPSMNEKDAGKYTAEVIAKLRMGDEGQEGMKAFFEKRRPNWYEE